MHPFEIDGRKYFINHFTQDLPRLDLIRWLEKHPFYPKVFWKDRDDQVTRAAVGNLFSFPHIPHFSGPHPFEMRLYGGIRFSEKYHKEDTTWRGFPETCFWLPQIELSQSEGKTEATFYFSDAPPCFSSGHFDRVDACHLPPKTYSLMNRQEIPTSLIWKEKVDAVLEAISSGDIDKLVLARKTSLQFSQPVSAWHCLSYLLDKAKRATLFAFQLSPSVCFLGATPEKLFERKGNRLSADVLAATKPRGINAEEDLQFEKDLQSSAKERREFNIVKDFLETTFAPLAEEMKWEGADRILKASHVQHIYNRLNAILKSGVSDEVLIRALHPTPALGGFPQEKAFSYLKHIETFDRGWYGGPIGVISPQGANLYVAIRSALIRESTLHLFAGTGLVQGSIPEREWDELEHKIRPFVELFFQ